MDGVSIADYFIRWVPVVIGNAYLATKSFQYSANSPFKIAFRYIGLLTLLCGVGVSLWILTALTANQAVFTLGLTAGTIIIHCGLSLFWMLIWRIGFQQRVAQIWIILAVLLTNIIAAAIYIADSYGNTPPLMKDGFITQNHWIATDISFSLGFVGMLITGIVFLRAAAINTDLKRKVATLSHALWMLTLSTYFILSPYISRTNFSREFYLFVAVFFITGLALVYRLQRKVKNNKAHA